LRVLADPQHWPRLSQNARQHAEAHYDIEVLNERLERFFLDLAGRKEKNEGGADV